MQKNSLPITIFEFIEDTHIHNWTVINDSVMGGLSKGHFSLTDKGCGVFSGNVSTQNNGGFSMVRCVLQPVPLHTNISKIALKLKGDGKTYQLRIKHTCLDDETYVAYFQTTKDWQTVEIKLSYMYPSYRGVKLNMPNFNHQFISEVALLIGNKKEESFRLEISSITLI